MGVLTSHLAPIGGALPFLQVISANASPFLGVRGNGGGGLH